MKVMSRDGTTIAYSQVGTGPAVVLVDAASCYRGFGPMGELAAALSASFTVYTYDRRGRGESTDTPPYAVEREVEDLAAVIEVAGGTAFVHGFSSGAVLALHAAAHGLPITALTLLEPPLGEDSADDPLRSELEALLADGRRGDAYLHFQRSIGVPEEYVAGQRSSPQWPAFEALAHTLVYDTVITSTLPHSSLTDITTPTLVVDSEASDERLHAWASGVASALPRGTHRTLPGEWHGVAASELAPVMAEFFTARLET
jgi:pimeloyl-ACP methyl ester carboxylesterase